MRTTTNLNMRAKAAANSKIVATAKTGVLLRVMAAPVNGWVLVACSGKARQSDPKTIFSEEDIRSSIEATRGGEVWIEVTLEGYVDSGFVVVEDGPA